MVIKSLVLIFGALMGLHLSQWLATGANDIGARDQDGRTVCAMDGRSYYVRPGPYEISYLKRTPDNDAVCLRPVLSFPLGG